MDGSAVIEKTVAEHIVSFLERRNVEHVFGLCGHTNIAVLAALADSPIDFITVRHEQIASHAADAYARVTGKASVVLSHLSPGLQIVQQGLRMRPLIASRWSSSQVIFQRIITASTPIRRSICTRMQHSGKSIARSSNGRGG